MEMTHAGLDGNFLDMALVGLTRGETGFGIEPNSSPFIGNSTGLKPVAGTSQLNQSYRAIV